jgi:hypothetical protein
VFFLCRELNKKLSAKPKFFGYTHIYSILFIYPTFPRRQKRAEQDIVLDWIVMVLERFWSYILIFGIPAIRKWARSR